MNVRNDKGGSFSKHIDLGIFFQLILDSKANVHYLPIWQPVFQAASGLRLEESCLEAPG